MITENANEMQERICALTQELQNETNPKRKAQLALERSLFANMFMDKKVELMQ